MGMSYLEAARIMMGGAGNVGPKPDHVTVNGTYYAEDDELDGYTQFVVAIPLSGTTFTDNGSYTADVGGWNSVTVNVKTWKDEYDAMKECCDKVSEAILDNWPNNDEDHPKPDEPWPDPDDPTKPTIEDAIPIISGYIFPPGTPIRDLEAVTGGNPITDTTTGVKVELVHSLTGWDQYAGEMKYFNFYSTILGLDYFPEAYPYQSTCLQSYGLNITVNGETYYWQPYHSQWGSTSLPNFNCQTYCSATGFSIDPVTGDVELTISQWTTGYQPTIERYIGNVPNLIGYGDSSHQYKVSSGSNEFTPETTPT